MMCDLHQWCVISTNDVWSCITSLWEADQKRNDYRIPIKSRRWYRYLAFFFIETAGVNAFILRQLSPNHPKTKHLDFRLELVQQLIGDYSSRKRKCAFNKLEQVGGQTHFPKQTKLNCCVYCASKGIRKRSTLVVCYVKCPCVLRVLNSITCSSVKFVLG